MMTQEILTIINTNKLEVYNIEKSFYVVTGICTDCNYWRSAPTYHSDDIITDLEIWRNIYNSLRFKQAPLYILNKVVYVKGFPLNKNNVYRFK